MTATPNRRPAFTLVEMLVATALIIFMMYIITSAFESGLTSFRVLKAQGDLQEKLRQLTTTLRSDLTAEHFGGDFFPPSQGPYLSHQRLNDQTWTPPQKGYFRIAMPFQYGIAEGTDPDAAALQYRRINPLPDPSNATLNPANWVNLYLQFTVNMTDGHPASRDGRARRDQFYSTDADGAILPSGRRTGGMHPWNKPDYNVNDVPFASQWAEVTWFLQPNGQSTTGGGPLPLYTLFRRQKLLVEPSATAHLQAAGLTSVPPETDPRYGVYRRVNPSDPAYPPRTFPRFLRDAAPLETDRDFPDISSWYTGFNSQNVARQFAFNSPADVTVPVRRWGMNLPGWEAPPANSVPPPPPAYGQPQVDPSVGPQPFRSILAEAASPAGPYADPLLGPRIGGDIVLTDIVNFEIKVLWEPVRAGAPNTDKFNAQTPAGFTAPPDFMEPSAAGNPDFPFDVLPLGLNQGLNPTAPPQPPPQPNNPQNRPIVRVFDTWSSTNDRSGAVSYLYGVDPTANDPRDGVPLVAKANSAADPDYANWNAGHFTPAPLVNQFQRAILPPVPGLPTQPYPNTNIFPQHTNIPLRVRVRALQIKVRIWDRKTSQTRQVTIIQDV
jgi:type II secretory pathway pseudopilin PulG